MRKITESQAIKLINQGIYPKCLVSREVFEPVKSLGQLDHLKSLGMKKVQSFELFEDTQPVSLNKNAMTLDIDEAFELLSSKETIHCVRHETDTEITTINELKQFINSCNIRGDKFLLYWKI